MKSAFRFILVILFASLLLTACGGAAKPVSGSFVGKVDGSDAFIAVILHKNGEVTAYVCDSADISAWFKGSVDGSSLDLTNADGARLTADLAADSFTGTFTPSGSSPLTFTVTKADQPAGLYRGEDTVDGVDLVAGWIVLPNGDQRGSVSGGGKVVSAPALNTSTRTGKGTNWVDPDPLPWIDPDTQP
jgi:serine/threonine-protein kinase